MLRLCHSVEGLAKLGSRAAAGFTAPRLRDKINTVNIMISTSPTGEREREEMYGQEINHSTDLSIMLLLHCSSLTNISISSFRWCILDQRKICYQGSQGTVSILHRHTHTHTHTPGDHLVLVPGCDSRLWSCCSVGLQREKDSVQSLRRTDETLHHHITRDATWVTSLTRPLK